MRIFVLICGSSYACIQALSLLKLSLTFYPYCAAAYFSIATQYVQMGKSEKAVYNYHLSIHFNPEVRSCVAVR